MDEVVLKVSGSVALVLWMTTVLVADQPRKINVKAAFTSPHKTAKVTANQGGRLDLTATTGDFEGIKGQVRSQCTFDAGLGRYIQDEMKKIANIDDFSIELSLVHSVCACVCSRSRSRSATIKARTSK